VLADVRLQEAGVLLSQGCFDGAYYLAGYAIECALKACIAKLTQEHDFPKREASSHYSHKLNELVRYAGIEKDRQADSVVDAALAINWSVVIVWNEGSRYERITDAKAQELYDAIADPAHGVLPWLKKRW
jgi:HEPN domain-containing protein